MNMSLRCTVFEWIKLSDAINCEVISYMSAKCCGMTGFIDLQMFWYFVLGTL